MKEHNPFKEGDRVRITTKGLFTYNDIGTVTDVTEEHCKVNLVTDGPTTLHYSHLEHYKGMDTMKYPSVRVINKTEKEELQFKEEQLFKITQADIKIDGAIASIIRGGGDFKGHAITLVQGYDWYLANDGEEIVLIPIKQEKESDQKIKKMKKNITTPAA